MDGYKFSFAAHAKDKDDSNPASWDVSPLDTAGFIGLAIHLAGKEHRSCMDACRNGDEFECFGQQNPSFGKPYVRMVCTLEVSIKDTPGQLRSSGWAT